MRIGILADIHDEVENLKAALIGFEGEAVDQIVSLGDAFDTWRPAEPGAEVARLLQGAGAKGVWGNHDFALSQAVSPDLEREADPFLLEFARTLHPWLAVENSRFSHLAGWLDVDAATAVWPMTVVQDADRARDSFFEGIPENFLFVGHFHCWTVLTRNGPLPWSGEGPLSLDRREKNMIIVGAVTDGWSGVFDTEAAVLTPLRAD